MGSSSSRNVEASQGSQRCRRERGHVDACFFGRRHHNSEAKNKRFQEKGNNRTPDSGCSTSRASVGEEASRDDAGLGSSSPQCRQAEIIIDRGCCEPRLTGSRTGSSEEDRVVKATTTTDVDDQVDVRRFKLQQDEQDEEVVISSCSENSSGECSSSASELEDEEASSSSEHHEQEEQGCDHDDHDRDGGQEADQAQVAAAAAAAAAEDEEPGPLRTAESRRNSGRRFWDALTRAATHRRNSTPITIVAIEEIDDNDSSMSRWNFQHWRAAVDGGDHHHHHHHHHDQHRELDDRRSNIRSHVWALQRLSGGLQVSRAHDRGCPAAAGRALCSCEAAGSGSDDSSTRASISRIIMLAEALFEVLDEIHRQSVALSRSAAMPPSSLPAPDEVVDSFPVHLYRRSITDEAAQCHICLIEYEDGDEMRVLPCQHEYHKACVDKWLKEVHRVCPLCRGDVCETNNNHYNVASS